MADPILKVEGLEVIYRTARGPVKAVDGLDFQLERGTTMGIIGESGAGKTSIGLALTGLLDPVCASTSGRATFKGKDLLSLSEDELAHIRGGSIGMLFQDPVASLDPTMRVVDQVAESIRLRGIARGDEAVRRALAELNRVGMDEDTLASAPYAHLLSGGQCQRAQIAATLSGSPDLLIADEPTSSLDTTRQKQILDLLWERRRQEGLAMIFISHDLPLVSSIADHLIVMRQGRVVESGPCAQVLSQPADDFTAELLKASAGSFPEGGVSHGAA